MQRYWMAGLLSVYAFYGALVVADVPSYGYFGCALVVLRYNYHEYPLRDVELF